MPYPLLSINPPILSISQMRSILYSIVVDSMRKAYCRLPLITRSTPGTYRDKELISLRNRFKKKISTFSKHRQKVLSNNFLTLFEERRFFIYFLRSILELSTFFIIFSEYAWSRVRHCGPHSFIRRIIRILRLDITLNYICNNYFYIELNKLLTYFEKHVRRAIFKRSIFDFCLLS